MSTITINDPIFDQVYRVQAWEDNNRTLMFVQGEGIAIPTDASSVEASHVKDPRFQLCDQRGAIDLSSGSPLVEWAVKRPRDGGEDLLACNIVTGQASNGIVEIPITKSLTEYAGFAFGEIRLITSNAVTKFYGINACIGEGISNEAASQSSQFDALTDALQKVVNVQAGNVAAMDTLVDGNLPNGTNPVASGQLKTFLENAYQTELQNGLLSSKVDKAQTIAGINLQDNITTPELTEALSGYVKIIDSETSEEWTTYDIPDDYDGDGYKLALVEETGELWYLQSIDDSVTPTEYHWKRLASYDELINELITKMDYAPIGAGSDSNYHQGQVFVDAADHICVKNEPAGTAGHVSAEKSDNKTNEITDSNKSSTANYPSNKGMTDYVDSLLSEKAPVINVDTDSAYDSDLSELAEQSVGNITVVAQQGNLGHPQLILSGGANLMPVIDSATKIGTVNGVTIELINGNSIRLNGTATGAIDIYLKSGGNQAFPLRETIRQGESATIGVLYSGSLTGGNCRCVHYFYNEDSSANANNSTYFSGQGIYKTTFQPQFDAKLGRVYIGVFTGRVFDNYVITPFMFGGTDVTVIDDPVYTDGKLDISSSVAENDYLSTYPNKHTVTYKADTKTYIDNKEIDPAAVADIADQRIEAAMPEINSTINTNVNTAVNAKVTYITPEQYGAVGNGVADDTEALQACLSHAGSAVFVKALKYYKTTEPVRITCDEGYVEINRIKYTGNDFAVKIATRNTTINIKQIEANSGGGVLIKNDNASGAVTANCLDFKFISTSGDCIKFEATEYFRIAYNSFRVPYLKSTNGNLINLNNSTVENTFFGGRVFCDNGWCIYKAHKTGTNTFMRFSFEKGTSQICYGTAKFVDCRTAEALNIDNAAGKPEGVFIKLVDPSVYFVKELSDEKTPVTFTGVDVSDLLSFSETMATLDDKIAEQDPENPQKYFIGCYDVINHCEYIIKNISRYRASGVSETLGGKMVIYWNKKAYVPDNEVLEDITTTPFAPLDTIKNNPTYFRIGVANCVINLNDSYCPIGIDSFIVEQTNDYKASIYNKDNTLIFDGANKPAGKYKVSCYITPLPSTVFDSVTNLPAADKAYYAERIRYVYTGSNEAWIVTPQQ